MGDHKEVFRSLQELFPQVDYRILKAISIEHRKDVDSAVVAVLDEVMPSMTGSAGPLPAHHEILPSMVDSVGNLFAKNSTYEVGSSSSADEYEDQSFTQSTPCIIGLDIHVDEKSNLPSDPIPTGNEHDSIPNLDVVSSNTSSERKLADSDNEVRCGALSTECPYQPLMGEDDGDNKINKALQSHDQDCRNTVPVGVCLPQSNSLKSFSGFEDINFDDMFLPNILPLPSNDEISSGSLSTEKDSFAWLLDAPGPDKGSSAGPSGVREQKETSNDDTGCNNQTQRVIVENGDMLLSSKTDMLPDLNLNHFASTASTHSSHSVSIESLEDSIVDARSNKNDLLPSLELVTKMIEDVELLEEKAKVAKHESSVAGTGILSKVEELKEMLTHAKEANDMHAGEVFGEKAILTTEVRELQSRLQRLSDERNKYLSIIEEIHQTLDERLIAAQQEIAVAEKEKIEKEAVAQALLDEQEKVMNSIVEESRKLQKEAEENLKLKEFLVERGQIVDTLQGEMAVICEDVSLLKQVVDERLSLSKLQRSTMSSLSSSVHSSLHKSWSSSIRTTEALEYPDKDTRAEATGPVAKDTDGMDSSVGVSESNDDTTGKGICKRVDSSEDGDGWELC